MNDKNTRLCSRCKNAGHDKRTCTWIDVSKYVTVIKNFICTSDSRLNFLKTQIKEMTESLPNVRVIVNYNTDENAKIVEKLYRKSVDNLDFRINLEKESWAKQTIELISSVDTPYIMYACEDTVWRGSAEDWSDVINEAIVGKEVDFLLLGKIGKYSQRVEKLANSDMIGEYVVFYNSENAPSNVYSVDCFQKKDIFVDRLKEYIDEYGDHSAPNWFERYYSGRHDRSRGMTSLNLSCAIPKNIIRDEYHADDDREFRW